MEKGQTPSPSSDKLLCKQCRNICNCTYNACCGDSMNIDSSHDVQIELVSREMGANAHAHALDLDQFKQKYTEICKKYS